MDSCPNVLNQANNGMEVPPVGIRKLSRRILLALGAIVVAGIIAAMLALGWKTTVKVAAICPAGSTSPIVLVTVENEEPHSFYNTISALVVGPNGQTETVVIPTHPRVDNPKTQADESRPEPVAVEFPVSGNSTPAGVVKVTQSWPNRTRDIPENAPETFTVAYSAVDCTPPVVEEDDSSTTVDEGQQKAEKPSDDSSTQLRQKKRTRLTAQKWASQKRARVGQTVTWIIRVRNVGRNTAHNIRVRDRIPSGMSLVGRPKGAKLDSGVLSWNIKQMRPRSTRVLRVKMRINSRGAGRRVCNRVVVKGGNTPWTKAGGCVSVHRLTRQSAPVTG